MKKYKLIKEYPGSPKKDFILDKVFSVNYPLNCYLINGLTFNPENHKEYWEEIIEKDYEILSFYNKEGKSYYNVITQGYYYSEPASSRSLTYCLLYYKIHSVKRLSDGEIFTIGDKVKDIYEETNVIINNFELNHNNININDNHAKISEINKVKQPLFTTEDGVDIFEGDTYYKVINETFQLLIIEKASKEESLKSKLFSKKEKAEEYILMNKKSLSPNDILKIWSKLSLHSVDSLMKNSTLMATILKHLRDENSKK